MPLKCFIKPNRQQPRLWTAKSVGQVYCLALRGGVTQLEMEAEFRKCDLSNREKPLEDAAAALAVAAQAIEQSNAVFDADAQSLQRFLALPILSAAALRFMRLVPVVGPALAATLPVLRHLASERITQIAVQKAANDAALVIVRRAAANQSRFLRTGT